MYADDEYDLAGFAVGMVDKKDILDKKKVREGDLFVGLASSGPHSNGYSLIRKIIADAGLSPDMPLEGGQRLGDALLTPTRIYVKPILALLEKMPAGSVHSICNITGGGFYENIPRAMPEGISVRVDKSHIPMPPVFKLLAEVGSVPERDMYNVFNMGLGMGVFVAEDEAFHAVNILEEAGEKAFVCGRAVKGVGEVIVSGVTSINVR
jgi:phosphoribosylformylglycinamidine cyclo-ligase